MTTRAELAARLRQLVPQMLEDAQTHRTWETPAAQADLAKPSERVLSDWVGDAEWHNRWAAFYEDVAATMEQAAQALEAG